MMSLINLWMFLFLFPFTGGKENVRGEAFPHPFHIAVTEVNQNSRERTLEISCRFFADDWVQTIEKNYKVSLDMTTAKDKALFDRFIPDYVNRHLAFSADGRPLKLAYVGYEKEKEYVHCYFEATGVVSLKRLEVVNSLLQDFSTDQINVVHISVNGSRQSVNLNYPASKAAFQF